MNKNFSLTRSRMWRTRAATALAAAGALVMSGGLVMLAAPTATATGGEGGDDCQQVASAAAPKDDEECPSEGNDGECDEQESAPSLTSKDDEECPSDDKKIVVCKYTETPPGVPDHIIVVDAPKDFPGTFPWTFPDAQDSVAIRFAIGNEQPGDEELAKCPERRTPKTPAGINTQDPCGPNNVSWTAKSDEFFTYSEANGVVTATLKEPDKYIASGTVTWKLSDYESNASCSQIIQVPAAPSQTDPCGSGNASWNVPDDTEVLDWKLVEGVLSVEIIPENVTFTDDSTSHSYGAATDSNTPCPQTIQIPAAPSQTDPCGPGNASWNLPADTDALDWSLVNGVLSVAIIPANVTFPDQTTSHSYGTATDSNEACIQGVESIRPGVTFQEPDCDNLDGAGWTGTFTDVVDYTVDGTPGLGEFVTVTAAIKPAVADDFAFVTGADTTFTHTYVTEAELACPSPTVLGSESSRPKPHKPKPTVLGTQAVAPTAVDAGLTGLPASGSSSNQLLAQLLVGGGLILLLAGGWLGFGRREYGAHEA